MAGAHETMEHAEHVEHAAGHNKQIALLIAVLALFLAFSETLGKSAQTTSIALNVEASNLWAFFQAKTIRRTGAGGGRRDESRGQQRRRAAQGCARQADR
jgi:hypothetical protein